MLALFLMLGIFSNFVQYFETMRKALVYISLLFVSLTSAAQDYGEEIHDVSKRLMGLQSSNEKIETIDADFVVEKKTSMLVGVQKSAGTMEYRRKDDYLSLHYAVPEKSDMVIAGTEISITTGEKTSSVSAKHNPAVSQMIVMIKSCVTGDFTSIADKSTVKYYQTADLFTMVISPKNARVKRYIKQIVLRYNNDNSLCVMKMDEGSGDYSEYRYTNQVITKK